MLDFKVDAEKCIGCGECVKDCLREVLEMDGDLPRVAEGREQDCIGCRHCFAVCKPGAVSIFGADPEQSLSIKGRFPEPERMEILIKGRRSCRRYKKEGVDPELIHSLLETVRHAPTAINNSSTRLTVVDDPAVMDVIREKTVAAAAEFVTKGVVPSGLERLADYFKPCLDGVDTIFRGAPHLLAVSCPKESPAPEADGFIALSYFELLAQSHGLGTVWVGLAKIALTMVAPEVGALLQIPEDHTLVYTMVFGKPAVKYYRTVQRPGGSMHRVLLDK